MNDVMVVDTSALIAILNNEPSAANLIEILLKASQKHMSSLSFLEAALVTSARKEDAGFLALESLIHRMQIQIVPLTAEHVEMAREAWMKFGKSRHSAKLNMGDTASYALAKYLGYPLLCIGNDFSQTDAVLVIPTETLQTLSPQQIGPKTENPTI